MSKGHKQGGKITGKHTTVIPSAEKVVDLLQKNGLVNKISVGFVKHGIRGGRHAIKIMDMENGAGIDYRDDIKDGTHPNNCGYEKMANVWFKALTGKGSPGLKYAHCKEQEEQEIKELNAYPETLVAKENILSSEVDEKAKRVVFTVKIPENGIIF